MHSPKFYPQSNPLRLTIIWHKAVFTLHIWCHCISKFENEQMCSLLSGEPHRRFSWIVKPLVCPGIRYTASVCLLIYPEVKSVRRHHTSGVGYHSERSKCGITWWGSWQVHVEKCNGLLKKQWGQDKKKNTSRNKLKRSQNKIQSTF